MSKQSIIQLTSVRYAESLNDFLNEHLMFGSCTVNYAKDLILNHKVYATTTDNSVTSTIVLYSEEEIHEVRHLAVATSLRGNGLGRALLDRLLEDNVGIAMSAVGWVTPNGWEADRIFRSYGFTVSSTNEDYWRSDCKDASFCPHRTDQCNCSATHVTRGIQDPFDF